jgi:DNA-directed DNA polymerase III PolC
MYLNCKTHFSFRYGTFKTGELVKTAVTLHAESLAITNINTTCDAWDFYDQCREAAIHPVLGAEIRNEDQLCYILLAKNLDGFAAINRFISEHRQQKLEFPEHAPPIRDSYIIYPFGKSDAALLNENEFIGITPPELNKLFGTNVTEYANKFLARQPVSFQNKKHHNLHRLLRAIDKNILLSRQQRSEWADPSETFLSPAELKNAFREYPFMIANTEALLRSCRVELDFGPDKTKQLFTGTKADDRALLEKLTMDGFFHRYGRNNQTALSRVKKELTIINDMGFNAYFLITWDIIRYAQTRGYYYVGRGSGANSIVAYCLCITDVDPIELDLYFERFLNPYRQSPPDFDIDFSWKDRDDVIDYVFRKYGREHVALLGMHSTFQRDASIRELGKVYGLPKAEIDTLVMNPAGLLKTDLYHRQVAEYGEMMQGLPNYLSIHPGGMLISEKPITTYAAVDTPPKGFVTAQMDMFIAEKINLPKLDILSQRGLGHIRECMEIVKANRGIDIDIHEIEKFKQDPKLADKIRNADTVGCFYIESPAMRQLLQKLRCDDYLTLVAASSIIRPGVAQSGMMRQYIYRFHNPGKFEYLHPVMKDLLEETYGVMVYQEDVMKVAHYFAGLEMDEADILRRAMSGKYRTNNRFYLIKEKFFRNCRQKGYDDAVTAEVWRQIESFGAYSFSKAHSASFAVESYQSLFLKTYFPMEFMVAVINNFGGFYNRELYFHELRKTGARIHAPCVNHSLEHTSIKGTDVYLGLVHVGGLEEQLKQTILAERELRGAYLHLHDFIERTGAAIEQLNILIRIGAFRFTGKNKKELLWEANFLQKKNRQHTPASRSMFREQPFEFRLPELSYHPLDDAYDEIEILGFPLGDIWQLVDTDLEQYISTEQLPENIGKEVKIIGYYVTLKNVRTARSEAMFFGTFLDKKGNWLDTVHFPQSARAYPLQGKGYYALTGKVTEEFGIYSVDVTQCEKLGIKQRYS